MPDRLILSVGACIFSMAYFTLNCRILYVLLLLFTEAVGFLPQRVTSSRKSADRFTFGANWDLSASRSICIFEPSDYTGEWPYTKSDLARVDSSEDKYFYDSPKFVTHIDDRAIESLTAYYKQELDGVALQKNGNIDLLDLCSSWVSHLPKDVSFGKVVGVGMNEEELAANPQLTEYYVQDLNIQPDLSRFEDNSFDAVCCVVSVDYLTSPLEIFKEIHRVLRPEGVALMSFSNRCFPTKAVAMWLQADDIGRMAIVGSYFHYSASWKSVEALDIKLPPIKTPERPSFKEMFNNPSAGFSWMNTAASVAKTNNGDPMYVVKGVK